MLPNISVAPDVQAEILKSFSDTYHDEAIGFGKRIDLIRMQQMQTVEKYGREGLMLVLEYELRLYTDE